MSATREFKSEAALVRRALLRLALAAATLSALLLISGARVSLGEDEREGLHFQVRCADASDSGNIASVSCALVITGLPDPLQDKVSVTIFTSDDGNDAPAGHVPGDTVVALEAPNMESGAPALITSVAPVAPHILPPRAPRVPHQPPQAV